MESLYGILYLTLSALQTATWTPPAPPGLEPATQVVAALPRPRPPTLFFRTLLAATPAERGQLLANHSPAERNLLLAKVRQYEAMPVRQCNQQLRTLELRWHLNYLMRQPASERAPVLQQLAGADRRRIETRLAFWDQLPAAMQQTILDHETAIRLHYSLPYAPEKLANLGEAHRRQIAQDIVRWKRLPETQQQEVYWNFKTLTELEDPPAPPGLTPDPDLPPTPEGALLEQFRQLPAEHQTDCLANFQQFQQLPREQRTPFLIGATRWRNLTEAQRESWRRAINNPETNALPELPPMPPGFTPPQPPPLPR